MPFSPPPNLYCSLSSSLFFFRFFFRFSSSSLAVVLFWLFLSPQNSAAFLNVSEILLPELKMLKEKLRQQNWTREPSNVFANLYALLAGEYRAYQCNVQKCDKAFEDAERFGKELGREAERIANNAERGGGTNEMQNRVATQFGDTLMKMPKGAHLNWHFKSADDRRICNAFANILLNLSNELEDGNEREIFSEHLQNGKRVPNCAEMVEIAMKLWLLWFPQTAEDGGKTDRRADKTPQLNYDHQNGQQNQLHNSDRNVSKTRADYYQQNDQHPQRRHKRDLEMVKHVTALGVSLCAAYFVCTTLKSALEHTLDYFDHTITVFGTAVLLYLGTLYAIEKRFKKVSTKRDAHQQQGVEASDSKGKTNAKKNDSLLEELVNPTTTVTVMDIVSYKNVVEQIYGRELDTADVWEQYKDYCKQMDKIKGSSHRMKTEYGANSSNVSKCGMPTERTGYGMATERKGYGNLGRKEKGRGKDSADKDKTEWDDLPSDYEEYLEYVEQKRNKLNSKKNCETAGENEKKSKKGVATRLPMPGYYEMRAKNSGE